MGICHSSSQTFDKGLLECTYDNTEPLTYNFTKAKVIKVYDGDTLTIAAYYNSRYVRFQVRLYGIDCEEMKGEHRDKAIQARDLVQATTLYKIVDIEVLNNKIVNGKKITEKYGRLLAKISINGHDLSELLFNANLARRYYGGKK